jgi:hypothetical protein
MIVFLMLLARCARKTDQLQQKNDGDPEGGQGEIKIGVIRNLPLVTIPNSF